MNIVKKQAFKFQLMPDVEQEPVMRRFADATHSKLRIELVPTGVGFHDY